MEWEAASSRYLLPYRLSTFDLFDFVPSTSTTRVLPLAFRVGLLMMQDVPIETKIATGECEYVTASDENNRVQIRTGATLTTSNQYIFTYERTD
jgi:hypothetical protein